MSPLVRDLLRLYSGEHMAPPSAGTNFLRARLSFLPARSRSSGTASLISFADPHVGRSTMYLDCYPLGCAIVHSGRRDIHALSPPRSSHSAPFSPSPPPLSALCDADSPRQETSACVTPSISAPVSRLRRPNVGVGGFNRGPRDIPSIPRLLSRFRTRGEPMGTPITWRDLVIRLVRKREKKSWSGAKADCSPLDYLRNS